MKPTTLINLHGLHLRKGDAVMREDGEVIIRNAWIYIGRYIRWLKIPESRWRNDYKEGRDGTLEEIIAKYEADTLANRSCLPGCPRSKAKRWLAGALQSLVMETCSSGWPINYEKPNQR